MPAPVCSHIGEFEGNDEQEGRTSAIDLLKPGSLHNMYHLNLVRLFLLGTMMHEMTRDEHKKKCFFDLRENIYFQDHAVDLAH